MFSLNELSQNLLTYLVVALFLSGVIGGCFFPYDLLPHNKTLIFGKISPTFQTCNSLTLKRIKEIFFRSGTTLKRWFGEHLLKFFWKILGKKKIVFKLSNCKIVVKDNFLGIFWKLFRKFLDFLFSIYNTICILFAFLWKLLHSSSSGSKSRFGETFW